MKFIHYLEHITGVSIYPLTSLTTFFLFFAVVTLWSVRADKRYIESLKNIPFPDKNNQ